MIRIEPSELESELIHDPDSYDLRERLLSAYAENRDTCRDPRRIEHIRWFIRNHPGDIICRTPFVHVYPDEQPDVHAILKEDWLHALAARPADVDVVRAAANFLALSDRDKALQLLRDAVTRDPGNGSLRVELGRLSIDPRERLAHFQAGLTLGAADAPNLLSGLRALRLSGASSGRCRGLRHRGKDRARTTGLGRGDAREVQ